MKYTILLLTVMILSGCFKGRDAVNEYKNSEDLVEYAPEKKIVYEKPESDFYLDPQALQVEIPTQVSTDSSLNVIFRVQLSGSLAEQVVWQLSIKNALKGLKISEIDKNAWQVQGQLERQEIEALFSSDYNLKFKLDAIPTTSEGLKDRLKYYNPPLMVKLKFI